MEDQPTYDFVPIREASWEAIATIKREWTAARLTWPDDEESASPLLVDASTAQVMVLVHDFLSRENRATLEKRVAQSRTWFLAYVNFCWMATKGDNPNA